MRLLRGLLKIIRSLPKIWNSVDHFQKVLLICLILLGLFMALPVIFIFNHALKPINELFIYPPRFIVQDPTFENFNDLFFKAQSLLIPFTRYLFNSVLSTAITVLSVIFISSLAAYAFSKQQFPGRAFFFALTIFALMFAPEAVYIPRYLVIAELGIMNTYLAHILPLVAAPVAVFLMKQFIDQIPKELMDAAKIDGAKEITIFMKIVMPVCVPAAATVGILAFQGSWSQFETSSLYTQVESMKTLPYFVLTLTNGLANNVVGQGMAAAATLMVFLPNLLVFLLFQKKVIATMAHSGIK